MNDRTALLTRMMLEVKKGLRGVDADNWILMAKEMAPRSFHDPDPHPVTGEELAEDILHQAIELADDPAVWGGKPGTPSLACSMIYDRVHHLVDLALDAMATGRTLEETRMKA